MMSLGIHRPHGWAVGMKGDKQSMEEKSFTKKPFAKKPYRVDAKALESKGFEMIRYDRHESYAKIYFIDGRAFIGSVNPVTGDRTISKAGPFASVKDMEDLRDAWDRLSEDVLGPRPTALNSQDPMIMGNYAAAPAASDGTAPGDGSQNENEGKASGAVCPHCGKSHYTVDYIKTTALATPTVVRDGMIVPQPEANKAVACCTCLECGKSFETGQIPLGQMVKSDPIPTTVDAADKGAE